MNAQSLSARLAAAGSRRAEMESLLRLAPLNTAPKELRRLVVDENAVGKASAASRGKVWQQLKASYLLDPAVPEYRALLEGLAAASAPADRGLLLFLMLARTDRLFRELTLSAVSPELARPSAAIQTGQVQQALLEIVGSDVGWSHETLVTVRQHALSALKDFGVLQGGTKKKTARLRPGPHVVLFATRLAQLTGCSPRQTLSSVWFQLLGLDEEHAWEAMHAAAAAGVLRCRRQADVIELELPPLPPAPSSAA